MVLRKLRQLSQNIELKRLKKWYKDELARKDKEIAELKEKNLALMKVAMKQSDRFEDMKGRFEKKLKKRTEK